MFVLQECSVCFEDFDDERNPHNIPCGHVFCRPCLESLISTPNCPNCRTAYTAESIRKVVCAEQDATTPASTESDEEKLMWQALQSSVETSNDYEQRKMLVRHNPPANVREAGMSEHLLIALDILQMLVKTEQRSHSLKEKVDTARAVEESLCDRISMLEAQMSAKTGDTSTNSHELQLLLAQVRALQSSVHLIKTDTSSIMNHLNTEPRTPVPPPTPVTPDASPAPTLRASTSKPALLRKPSPPTAGPSLVVDQPPQYARQAPNQSPQQEYFLPHARTPSGSGLMPKQLMSPPVTPAAQGRTLLAPGSPMARWSAAGREDMPLPAVPVPQSPRSPVASGSTFSFPRPEGLRPSPTPTSTTSPANPFRSPRSPAFPVPTFPSASTSTFPMPTPTPKPTLTRKLTTTHPYKAGTPNEHSFVPNQTLHLLPESDMSQGKDWVWCRAEDGTLGYAPRSYLKAD